MINFEELDARIEALSPDELAELLREAMIESGLEGMIKEGESNVFATFAEECCFDYIEVSQVRTSTKTLNYRPINNTTEWLTGSYKYVGEFTLDMNKAG